MQARKVAEPARLVSSPAVASRFERVFPWALGALALACLLVMVVPHLSHSNDDSFITYRYAQNLALGRGFVFNPGEQHLATTAPGWGALLGALAVPFGVARIPAISGLLSLLALLGSVWLLARRWAFHSAITFSLLLLLVATNRWLVEVLGHETLAETFIVLAALAALEERRPATAGLLFSLATAIRPDAGVLGAAAGLHEWRIRKVLPLRLLLAYVVLTAAFAAVLLRAAGTLLPASIAVKRAEASQLGLVWGLGCLQGLGEWFVRDFGFGGLGLVALASWGLWQRTATAPPGLARLLTVAAASLAFYPLVRVTFAPWYFVLPLLVLLFLAVSPAASAVIERSPTRLGVAAALIAVSIFSSASWLVRNTGRPPHPRMRQYTRIGEWIGAHSDARESLAAVEVGFLGFASDRPIVDLLGLGSPGGLEALEHGRVADFFFERSPAFFVRHPTFDYLQGDILRDSRFVERYTLAAFVPSRTDASVEVYQAKERGLPANVEQLPIDDGEDS